MTLKEITDLLEVRHNDAMRTVEKMQQDQSFGASTKISYKLLRNNAEFTIQTYQLDKRQSIAVASRLNTALLMKVIDRWQELETANIAPPPPFIERTPLELLNEAVAIANEKEAQVKELTKRITALQIAGLQIVTEIESDLYFNVAAKILETNLGVQVGHNSLMEVLRAKGYLLMGTRSYYEKNMPAQKYTHLFRVILQRNQETGVMSHTTVIRPEGLAHIAPMITGWLTEHNNAKLLLNNQGV